MIKIENTEVYGWEAAIRGCRNPLNSWDKSDSKFFAGTYISEGKSGLQLDYRDIKGNIVSLNEVEKQILGSVLIGPNDYKLLKNLCRGGSEESKWRRFVTVSCDITAPLYWISEHDTYKVGTSRNSCSFMHKGTSKPFTINDFSVQNPDIYYLLNPISEDYDELIYPYETDEYKTFEMENGRKYKIFKNGKIIACEFSCIDSYGKGRHREFAEREIKPSVNKNGYYEVHLGGRSGHTFLLHRLVALVWIPNPNKYETVNHIDCNKGNNSYENLEWCSREENIKFGFEAGIYDNNKLHATYDKWKRAHKTPIEIRLEIIHDYTKGIKPSELSKKYSLDSKVIDNILFIKSCECIDLFHETYVWEKMINNLNSMRELYLETRDDEVFQGLRQLLPCGYNQRYTWTANYEVLANIYRQRKNHRLKEWRDFCSWIKMLPYSELITLEE